MILSYTTNTPTIKDIDSLKQGKGTNIQPDKILGVKDINQNVTGAYKDLDSIINSLFDQNNPESSSYATSRDFDWMVHQNEFQTQFKGNPGDPGNIYYYPLLYYRPYLEFNFRGNVINFPEAYIPGKVLYNLLDNINDIPGVWSTYAGVSSEFDEMESTDGSGKTARDYFELYTRYNNFYGTTAENSLLSLELESQFTAIRWYYGYIAFDSEIEITNSITVTGTVTINNFYQS